MFYGNLILTNKRSLQDWFYLEMMSYRAFNDIIQTLYKKMHLFFFLVCCIVTDCSWRLRFDKKQNVCIKHTHLPTNNGLYDRKAFQKVKNCFYLLFLKGSSSLQNFDSLHLGLGKNCDRISLTPTTGRFLLSSFFFKK